MNNGSVSSVDHLRIHQWIPASLVNGPGRRFVVWVQGCSIHCPGCFNPQTHAPGGGSSILIHDLIQHIQAESHDLEGFTLSGGEPFEQPGPVARLLSLIHTSTSLSTIVFTGLTWEAVQCLPEWPLCSPHIDVLIAGPFLIRQRQAGGLAGSNNQTFHFLTSRYQHSDFEKIPPAEIILDRAGGITMSGIDPLNW